MISVITVCRQPLGVYRGAGSPSPLFWGGICPGSVWVAVYQQDPAAYLRGQCHTHHGRSSVTCPVLGKLWPGGNRKLKTHSRHESHGRGPELGCLPGDSHRGHSHP